ncbi:helix-turn-helix domain-containing protein, partial [Candidatus Methanoperedens nitratireducens]
MKKAYTFRIYPSKNQEVKLNRTLTTCRRLYNLNFDDFG